MTEPIFIWKWSHECGDMPQCPHCGDTEYDWWEWDLEDGHEHEVGCNSCGENFVVVMNQASPTFDTRKVDAEKIYLSDHGDKL